jgi:F5/8 type C domain
MFDVNLARDGNLVFRRIVQMNDKNFALGLATLALSIANVPNAQAALINGVTASTDMGTNFGNINNIVNGSGLPGNIPSLTGNHPIVAENTAWWSSVNLGNNITFNLNGTYSLAGFSLWNAPWIIGVKGVNVLTSTDGTNFTTVAGAPTEFARGVDNTNIESTLPEQFSFDPVTASYVRFQVLNSHGTPVAGLSEVQFNSDSATSVPEPLTILGTLTGLGGGAILKRRLKVFKSKSV